MKSRGSKERILSIVRQVAGNIEYPVNDSRDLAKKVNRETIEIEDEQINVLEFANKIPEEFFPLVSKEDIETKFNFMFDNLQKLIEIGRTKSREPVPVPPLPVKIKELHKEPRKDTVDNIQRVQSTTNAEVYSSTEAMRRPDPEGGEPGRDGADDSGADDSGGDDSGDVVLTPPNFLTPAETGLARNIFGLWVYVTHDYNNVPDNDAHFPNTRSGRDTSVNGWYWVELPARLNIDVTCCCCFGRCAASVKKNIGNAMYDPDYYTANRQIVFELPPERFEVR
jgi:hypothetical protein